jgi:hypothetical protein
MLGMQQRRDLSRISMKVEKPPRPIDPFRIWLQAKGARRAVLNIGWADRLYAVDIAVP